jgi:hypothetical protein
MHTTAKMGDAWLAQPREQPSEAVRGQQQQQEGKRPGAGRSTR